MDVDGGAPARHGVFGRVRGPGTGRIVKDVPVTSLVEAPFRATRSRVSRGEVGRS
jgi:hypothetical protein